MHLGRQLPMVSDFIFPSDLEEYSATLSMELRFGISISVTCELATGGEKLSRQY